MKNRQPPTWDLVWMLLILLFGEVVMNVCLMIDTYYLKKDFESVVNSAEVCINELDSYCKLLKSM